MLTPHENCILQAGKRYFWDASICYKSEQIITFVEVDRSEKFASGKVVSVNYAIRRYENGILVVSYQRSILNAKIKEKAIKIIGSYNMSLSESEMNLVIKKEMEYALQK